MTTHVTPDGLSERVVTRTVWEAETPEQAMAAAMKMTTQGRSEKAVSVAILGFMWRQAGLSGPPILPAAQPAEWPAERDEAQRTARGLGVALIAVVGLLVALVVAVAWVVTR